MKKGIFKPNASAGYLEYLSYFNFKPSKPLLFINISGISCFSCLQPCTESKYALTYYLKIVLGF